MLLFCYAIFGGRIKMVSPKTFQQIIKYMTVLGLDTTVWYSSQEKIFFFWRRISN